MVQNNEPLTQTSAQAAALSRQENQRESEREAREHEMTTVIEEPAKIMRIGEMIKRLLEEVRSAPLDEAARARLAQIHERSLSELEEGLSEDLVDELHRITLPFGDDSVPSESELRIAQAQLVGWLEGLFHGIQAALYAQQVQAQSQLQNMRLALPGPHDSKGDEGDTSGENNTSGGMYL